MCWQAHKKMGTSDFLCHRQEEFLGQELVWKGDSVTRQPYEDKAVQTTGARTRPPHSKAETQKDKSHETSEETTNPVLRRLPGCDGQSEDCAMTDWVWI